MKEMGSKLFRKDIEPKCIYCEHGTTSPDGQTVVCRKIGGIMQYDSACKKFKYNPLKREPRVAKPLTEFSKEDFEL